MYNTRDIFEVNQRVCFDLWRIAASNQVPSALSPHLIFPEKRDRNVRISEQEARILYCHQLNATQYYYSIETPTQDVYQQTGTSPISASSDVSLYVHTGQAFQKMINVEFKAHNVPVENIRKDIEKLIKERIAGNWFHTLKNVDSGTLPSLFGKCSNALKASSPLLSKPEDGWYTDISLVFCFCVLEKQWACTKQFFYQSALQAQKSFAQYVEDFFRLEYSTTRQSITVTDPNGWTFCTPETINIPETTSYTVSIFTKEENGTEFQETILGVFSTPSHALSAICKQCEGQYLQITYQDGGQTMVHITRHDVIYEAVSWNLNKKKTGYIDLPVGEEYAPYENRYVRIEKLNE